MPKIDGFGVVERVNLQHLPPTVFVTAYHEHVVRAFDVHAVDYLTKPVEAPRLRTALERVRKKIDAESALLTREQFTAVLNGLRTGEESKAYTSRFLVKDAIRKSYWRRRRSTGSKPETIIAACMREIAATCSANLSAI
jgi:two-component system LytT family response regulator